MEWTKEQKKAIEERNKKMLVAAAAGSGKTAVLVERIRRQVCEEQVNLRNILIVTFTNAAAAEMKEKIRHALEEEAIKAEAKGDSAKLSYVKKQLADLPSASISTFHAFALEVIHRFFYLIDAEPKASICDEAKSVLMQEEAMDLLFEDEFANMTPEFTAFMDAYSSDRNPKGLRELLLGLYRQLMAMPAPWEWTRWALDELGTIESDFAASAIWKEIIKSIRDTLREASDITRSISVLLDENGLERMAGLFETEKNFYAELAEFSSDGEPEEILAFLNQKIDKPAGVTLRAKEEEKETYEGIKEQIQKLRKTRADRIKKLVGDYLILDLREQINDVKKTKPFAETLVEVLKKFHTYYREEKDEKGVMDFNDIEHFCLEILGKEEAASHYRERFSFILIDEYQDTNYVQEEIVSRIAREDNLFMVGDIKQSIYGFRLAEPEIFSNKYKRFKSGEESSAEAVDLNKNFRSRKKILDLVNSIFEKIMEGYDEDACLYPGLSPERESLDPSLDILLSNSKSDGSDSSEEADDLLEEMLDDEKEALYVASIIKSQLGEAWYDEKAGCERALKPGDITVLLRNARNSAQVYSDVFKECGIMSAIDDRDGYFDTMEVMTFINLLTLLDNPMRDVELLGVLRSPIFGFTTEELARIRINHKEGSYYEAFIAMDAENDLGEKCRKTIEIINTWREESRIYPLDKFIWKLLLESGHYILSGAMYGGMQRQANLRALCDMATKFGKERQASLYSFVRYIDSVIARKVKTPEITLGGDSENRVRIMTIHKSKGLEFPMVILAGLGKGLKYDTKKDIVFHRELGIGMSYINSKERWSRKTLIQKTIGDANRRRERNEEKRVLYVAMTRARDRLFLTGTYKDEDKLETERLRTVPTYANYLGMVLPYMKYNVISQEELPTDLLEEEQADLKGITYSGSLSKEERERILYRLEYVYPYEQSRTIKSKYSVSEINHTETEEREHIFGKPSFASGEAKLGAAEIGTAYHMIMERIDFATAEKPHAVEDCIDELVSIGLLTSEEAESVSPEIIAGFFKSDLGRRAVKANAAGLLEKERPFTMSMEKDGETILVQGIIDCYFREKTEDGYKTVLLDYKSNRFRKGEDKVSEEDRIAAMYGPQIALYKEALEKVGLGPVEEAYLYLLSEGITHRMD